MLGHPNESRIVTHRGDLYHMQSASITLILSKVSSAARSVQAQEVGRESLHSAASGYNLLSVRYCEPAPIVTKHHLLGLKQLSADSHICSGT
jgi:hypothetical protein